MKRNINQEKLLWQRTKKGLTECFLTRIESSTMNGIPDLNGCINGNGFWMELKSDKVKYPKLSKWQISWINKHISYGGVVIICNETLLQRSIELYRPVSAFSDPRLLKPRFSFSKPVHWPSFQDAVRELAGQRSSRSRSLVEQSRFSDSIRDGTGSLSELDMARVS